MTRETKVGLVVACSFLCLVGIVVASKWRGGDDPTKEPELQEIKVAAIKEGQPANPPKEPAKNNDGRPGERPIEKKDGGGLPPINAIKPARSDDSMIAALPDATKKGAPIPPPLPLPSLPSASSGNEAPKPFGAPSPFAPDPNVPLVAPPALVSPGDAMVSALPKPLDPLPEKKKSGLTVPVSEGVKPIGGIDVAQGGNAKPTDPLPVFPLPPKDPLPVAKDLPPVFPPSKEPAPVAKDPLPVFPPPKDPLPVAKDPPPVFPPPKDPAPAVVAKEPTPLIPKGPSSIDATYPLPAPPLRAKEPIPRIPPETSAGVPTIVIPGAKPSLPIVKETTLDIYECRQGDNTFANLSMRFYGTDKYADALLLYNRANSAMVQNGSHLTINPPVLTPGQKVLNPSKDVLERDYPANLRPVAVAPMPANPGPAPAVKLTQPMPLVPMPNTSVAPIANPPVGGTYRVQNPNGESILDIAERTLGNRSRWTAIYDLNRANPAVQPQFRIPVGTELKMPAN